MYGTDYDNELHYFWILDPQKRTQHMPLHSLDSPVTQRHTCFCGHNTLLVMGDTLFYYTWNSGEDVAHAFPRLNALHFSSYPECKMTEVLRAQSILGYDRDFYWAPYWSPIYPIGDSALTVSVEDYQHSNTWAVDVAFSADTAAGMLTDKHFVHYHLADMASVMSASREILTTLGYTCRAFVYATAPLCHVIESG